MLQRRGAEIESSGDAEGGKHAGRTEKPQVTWQYIDWQKWVNLSCKDELAATLSYG